MAAPLSRRQMAPFCSWARGAGEGITIRFCQARAPDVWHRPPVKMASLAPVTADHPFAAVCVLQMTGGWFNRLCLHGGSGREGRRDDTTVSGISIPTVCDHFINSFLSDPNNTIDGFSPEEGHLWGALTLQKPHETHLISADIKRGCWQILN